MPPSNTGKAKKTTGNPAARRTTQQVPTPADPNDRYAPNAWLAGGIGQTTEEQMPSGQLCLLRKPGLQGLMTAGVLRKVDSLSALVDQRHVKGSKSKGRKGGTEEIDAASLLQDPKALEDIMHTVDRVVCHCVVQPTVVMTPNDVTRREDGVVYADMVDINDKMYIFNLVTGGVRDLETFRDELASDVGSLEAGEGVREGTE